ncbi:UNVERIFIED_CONTAM: hypothetical protein FKN15_068109 [Acipenser sinensis]
MASLTNRPQSADPLTEQLRKLVSFEQEERSPPTPVTQVKDDEEDSPKMLSRKLSSRSQSRVRHIASRARERQEASKQKLPNSCSTAGIILRNKPPAQHPSVNRHSTDDDICNRGKKRDATFLPNVKLGSKIHDSCGKDPVALKAAISLISPQDEAAAGTQYTGWGGVPLVSYYATCACLSNRQEFPNFFRTIPSNFYQARGMAQIAKHFGWTWIGTVASDNDYGRLATQTFIEEVEAAGACIAFSETLSTVYPKEDSVHIADLLKRLSAQSITSGVLGIAIWHAEIPGLAQFLVDVHPSKFPENVFVHELWENSFNYKLPTANLTEQASSKAPLCNGSENLREVKNGYTEVSHLGIAHNVYKAVYATAHALNNLKLCQNGSGPFQNKSSGNVSNLQPGQTAISSERAGIARKNDFRSLILCVFSWERRSCGQPHKTYHNLDKGKVEDSASLLGNTKPFHEIITSEPPFPHTFLNIAPTPLY